MDLVLAIGYLVIGGFACGALAALHVWFWRTYYQLDPGSDTIHRVRCSDGWTVALHRYQGRSALMHEPVLLCQGLGANRFHMDLTANTSLARYLNNLGFDVWILELRGVGMSSRPALFSSRSWNISFEDFVDRDAPAAVEHILTTTGARHVHWVGHGMGGMIGNACGQGALAKRLASLALVGAPGRLKLPSSLRFLVSMTWLIAWVPYIPVRFLSTLLAPFYFRSPLDDPFMRSENIEPETVRQMLVNLTEDIPVSLLREFGRWSMLGEIRSNDHNRNFTQGIASLTVPVLGIAGDDDEMAPPSTVRFAVERASSTRKAYINIGGEGTGAHLTPYGHDDLLLGTQAPREVFPRIAGWIAQVAGLDLSALAQEAAEFEAIEQALNDAHSKRAPAPAPQVVESATQPLPEPPMMLDEESTEASEPLPDATVVDADAGAVVDSVEVVGQKLDEPELARSNDAVADEAWIEPPSLEEEVLPEPASVVTAAVEDAIVVNAVADAVVVDVLQPNTWPEPEDHEMVGALEDLSADPMEGYDLEGGPTSLPKIQARAATMIKRVGREEPPEKEDVERDDDDWPPSEELRAMLAAPLNENIDPGRYARAKAKMGNAGRVLADLKRRALPTGELERSFEGEPRPRRPRPARLHRSPVSGGSLYEALKDAAARTNRVLPDRNNPQMPVWAEQMSQAERPPKLIHADVSEQPELQPVVEDVDVVE